MQLGVCIGSFENLRGRKAALPPFDYVEGHVQNFLVPEGPEKKFLQNLRVLKQTGLPMPAANCLLPGDLKVTGLAADLKRLEQYAKVAFRRARKAGISLIIFGSGVARQVPDRWPMSTGFEQYVAALRVLAPIAAKNKVTVLVEPLHRGECNLVNTVLEGAVAVARVNHPAVRLLVDFFHMLRNDESPDDIVKVGKWVRHAHIAEKAERTAPGVRGDDFRPFLRALAQIRYRGALSLECKFTDFRSEVATGLTTLRTQLADCGF